MKNQKGFSLVELLVVVIIIAIIAAIAIPNLLASRRVANEAAAVGSMRTFHSANTTFLALQSPNSYAATAADLSAAGVNLLDPTFAAACDVAAPGGVKGTYNWIYTFGGSTAPQTYTLTATSQTGSGQKSYYIDQDGAIHVHAPEATLATAADPAL